MFFSVDEVARTRSEMRGGAVRAAEPDNSFRATLKDAVQARTSSWSAAAPLAFMPPPLPATPTVPAPPPRSDCDQASPRNGVQSPRGGGPTGGGPTADFEGLRMGSEGDAVKRMQQVLQRWNPRLDVAADGRWDERTRQAVQLYKGVYGTGQDGRSMDTATAKNLTAMEAGTFWNAAPEKSLAGRILYAASQDLGKPYRMGGDGERSTDCAMLTRRSLERAGAADVTRLADAQYADAERSRNGMRLVADPKPGDLIFFDNPTRQSGQAYRGVTHVGIYMGGDQMLAASSAQGRVVLQRLQGLARHVVGYGRASVLPAR